MSSWIASVRSFFQTQKPKNAQQRKPAKKGNSPPHKIFVVLPFSKSETENSNSKNFIFGDFNFVFFLINRKIFKNYRNRNRNGNRNLFVLPTKFLFFCENCDRKNRKFVIISACYENPTFKKIVSTLSCRSILKLTSVISEKEIKSTPEVITILAKFRIYNSQFEDFSAYSNRGHFDCEQFVADVTKVSARKVCRIFGSDFTIFDFCRKMSNENRPQKLFLLMKKTESATCIK